MRLSYSDTDADGTIDPQTEIIEENNYYPFGLKHKGYNNVIQGGNGLAQNWDYQNKENQEELGLNWHDFGARQYDAAIGRWMSIDPLSEEFSEWSPYTAMNDNPISYIDPTGMSAEWVPTVSDAGEVSYVAEAGDSAATLADQYEIGEGLNESEQLAAAEKITGTKGNTEISAGTKISGQKVKEVTNSEVMKLDLNSDLATEQRVFDQYVFGADHSNANGKTGFYTTEYYGNVFDQANRLAEGFANFEVGGKNLKINYQIPLYDTKGVVFNEQRYSFYLSNSSNSSTYRNTGMFGKFTDIRNVYFNAFMSFGKGKDNLKRKGSYRITTPNSNGNGDSLYERFNN